jgi:hypothetical protein
MKLSFILLFSVVLAHHPHDFAAPCYEDPIPLLPNSTDVRHIPWGKPSIKSSNGLSPCCNSLDDVRAGINAVDDQLLTLLSQSYVILCNL